MRPHEQLARMHRRLPEGCAFSGRTAAWLLGLDVPFSIPVEVTIPESFKISVRAGATVRRYALGPGDVVRRQGFPTTSALRTATDLGGRLPLIEAAVMVDMALHAGLVTLDEMWIFVAANRGRKGIGRLRRVLELAEPKSESPMESRLRLLLVGAGLPRPEAQVSIRDSRGNFVARVDLYYPKQRLAIEYDGAGHRDRPVHDNRRQNALLAVGVRVLRYTAPDVMSSPNAIPAQVRRELAA